MSRRIRLPRWSKPFRRPRERGAALVETVLILPVVMMITFGVVEFSSAFHHASVVSDATRAGGRIASAQARNADYAVNAASAVGAVLLRLPADAPQEMWIYRANSRGFPGSGTGFTECSTDCIRFLWTPADRRFDTDFPLGGGWPAASHRVCGEPFDQIGVYVRIDHEFVTRVFGSGITLRDHSIFRFEPTPSAVCATT